MARPSSYTEEMGDYICEQLAEGISLKRICEREEMPDKATFFRWLRKYPELRDNYIRAKEESADALFEETIDIADETVSVIKSGAEKKSSAYAQAQKLRVDTRKWMMSKMKPKKYGDKLDMTSDGKAINFVIPNEIAEKNGIKSQTE